MIFDTHTHYDDDRYDEDRFELIESLRDKNVGMVVDVCATWDSMEDIKALTKKYDFIYGSVGLHPEGIIALEQDGDRIMKEMEDLLVNDPKMVAVGEIGLDYHYDEPSKDIQIKWFEEQMKMADRVKKPVIIHSREACEDTMEILRKYPDVKGVMHCYSYAKETAAELIKMGYYIGVGGVVTFKNSKKLKETVQMIPLDKLVLETDCPYLAPEPFRGTRNDSSLIKYVIEEVASLRDQTVSEIESACYENALRMYGIDRQE